MAAPAVAPRRWPLSAFFLVLANTAPLIGVLLHHWTVFAVVLLYWSENVIVGAFNVLRMLIARPQQGLAWAAKAFMIPSPSCTACSSSCSSGDRSRSPGRPQRVHGARCVARAGPGLGRGGADREPRLL